jgi:hypothetical protein
MRTKTLLLTAALSAAGLAMTQAQSVFSVNIVGYVNIDAPAGFSMMANPLDNGAGNKISDLFASAPDGTIVYRFVNNNFTINVFDLGDWSDPAQDLPPGEGAFLRLPTAATLTFVGEVKVGNLSNPLPQGFSIKSSQVPQAGALEADLKFPAADGDVIYTFSNTAGYSIFNYDFGAWDPSEPSVGVGEAYWVRKVAAGSWDRTFTVN